MTTEQKNQIEKNLKMLLMTQPELSDKVNQAEEVLNDKNFIEMFVDLVKSFAKKKFAGEEVEGFESWFRVLKTIFKVLQSEPSVAEIKFLF